MVELQKINKEIIKAISVFNRQLTIFTFDLTLCFIYNNVTIFKSGY